jgi:chitin synthase
MDSIDDFKRKQQEGLISGNNDFPPNIEKQLAMVYQNEWKPSYTMDDTTLDDTNIKLNIFTCFKHMNGKKLHSHLWFFEGFCRYLQPEFVVLLDVGTTPDFEGGKGYDGLSNLIRGFYANKDVGGVTGLMSIDSDFPSLEGDDPTEHKPNPIMNCLFSIEKAQ